MSDNKIEFQEIRVSIITFTICFVIAAALIGGSWYFQNKMKLEVQKSRSRFQSISQQYLMVDQEEGYIEEYYPEYKELIKQGLIGQEHRLNWIEVLRNANENNHFHSLSYQISSQNEYDFEFPIDKGNFKIFSSTMRLDLKLLHEGDFVYLLNELDQKAIGHYTVKSCTFNREGSAFKKDITRSNLLSGCELHWYSIKKYDGSELVDS